MTGTEAARDATSAAPSFRMADGHHVDVVGHRLQRVGDVSPLVTEASWAPAKPITLPPRRRRFQTQTRAGARLIKQSGEHPAVAGVCHFFDGNRCTAPCAAIPESGEWKDHQVMTLFSDHRRFDRRFEFLNNGSPFMQLVVFRWPLKVTNPTMAQKHCIHRSVHLKIRARHRSARSIIVSMKGRRTDVSRHVEQAPLRIHGKQIVSNAVRDSRRIRDRRRSSQRIRVIRQDIPPG